MTLTQNRSLSLSTAQPVWLLAVFPSAVFPNAVRRWGVFLWAVFFWAAFFWAACLCRFAAGGTPVLMGEAVPESARLSMEQVEHATWDALLQRYVDARGMVDYQAWKKSDRDQAALDQYLASLSAAKIPPSMESSPGVTRQVQLAFWINAYNALTVRGILREYPTSSIRNHTAKLFGYNIWNDLKLRIDGRVVSLDEIEHQILRKMNEPRIHFAIVCASIGCPRLLNRAYGADKLDLQLAENSKAFFADNEKFRVNAAGNRVYLSPILKWFAEDFGPDQASQLSRIAEFAPASAARVLLSSDVRVSYLDYDWDLNDQNPK